MKKNLFVVLFGCNFEKLFDLVTPIEGDVIREYYGIGVKPKTVKEITSAFREDVDYGHVTEKDVRRVLHRGINRMKRKINKRFS